MKEFVDEKKKMILVKCALSSIFRESQYQDGR